MKKIIAFVVLFFSLVPTWAWADSFSPTNPNANTATGVSNSSVNGVIGTCQAVTRLSNSSPAPLMNLDCAGNVGIQGNVNASGVSDASLTPGNCVQAASNGALTTTGSACGSGGGVTSVTGSGNIQSSGGTTPNVTITDSPTFSGNTTTQTLTSTATGSGPAIATWTDSIGFPVTLKANQLQSAGNVLNVALGLHTGFNNTNLMSIDDNGNIGINGNMFIGGIGQNQCVQTNNSGELVGTGSACGGGSSASNNYIVSPLGFFFGAATGPFQPVTGQNTNNTLSGFNITGTIKTLNVTCNPYNTTDTNGPYTGTSPGTNGITGGLVHIYDYHGGGTAPTLIGTITLANSPPGGPYVNAATLTLGSPYTLPTADQLTYDNTVNGTTSAWSGCVLSVGT